MQIRDKVFAAVFTDTNAVIRVLPSLVMPHQQPSGRTIEAWSF